MLSFFPRDVLDEIWDLTESVSEGFPSYFSYLLIQSVAKHLCYKLSFYNEQLSFLKGKENYFYQLFFSEFIHQVAIKFRFRKALQKKCFQADIIFRHKE